MSVLSSYGANTFDQCDTDGLNIHTSGAVILSKVNAAMNQGYGVWVANNGIGITASISYATGNVNQNGIDGVHMVSAGAVTITGVSASENGLYGILVTNNFGTANVSLSKCTVYENLNMGVWLTSNGVVSISSSKIDSNGDIGARINNTGDTSGTKGVTITSSTFNEDLYGLYIASHGPVMLTSITASRNDWYGAYIDNLTGTTTGTPAVKISGTNIFNNNSWDGLSILSKGTITLANITSSYNLGYGMNLTSDTGSAITITNVTLKQNEYSGITANSGGAINITGMISLFNGITADDNGAYLNANGHDITIKNSAFNANGRSGIYALTGATNTLYLTSVNFFGNDYFGGFADPDLYFNGLLVLN